MMRALRLTFLVGLGVLCVGLVIVNLAAAAAGSWWSAREPWIGIGLDAIVVGLAIVHFSAPALALSLLGTRRRWPAVAFAALLVGATAAFVVTFGPNLPMAVYVALLLAWTLAAVVVSARSELRREWPASGIVIGLVAVAVVMSALWWLIGYFMAVAMTGFGRPLPSLENVGTLIYSVPDLALVILAPPTFALTALALEAIIVRRRSGAGHHRDPATVLT
jgi:hypothetical protein